MTDPAWLPWALRAAWLTLPLTAGTLLTNALDDRSATVAATAAVLAWAAWAAGVLAVLVARPAGLVVARVTAVAAVAVAVWASIDSGDAPALVLAAAVPLLVVFTPAAGAWFVNGAAYGDERRHLLRLPGPLVLGPVPLAALLLVTGLGAGPLLLAANQWIAGSLALVVGLPAVVLAWRALYALTQRWAVLVPAGLVLKDHVVLADPMLFRRADIDRLGAAPAGTDAVDLTAGAFGLAVELRLRASQQVVREIAGALPEPVVVDAVLFTPTRPGRLVRDAEARRIAVG
jgi:hypothetical protein